METEGDEWHLNRTAYGPAVLMGLSKDYQNLTDWFNENLVPGPDKADKWRKVYAQCYDSNWNLYENSYMGGYFKDGYKSLFSPVPLSVMNNAGKMVCGSQRAVADFLGVAGQMGVPKVPLYVYQVCMRSAQSCCKCSYRDLDYRGRCFSHY